MFHDHLYLFTLICLSLFFKLNAQDSNLYDEKRFYFMAKGGLNYSNAYKAQSDTFFSKPSFGFVGGVSMKALFGYGLFVCTESLFSQKGFRAKSVYNGSILHFNRVLNFIDIPIYLGFRPNDYFSLLAGLQYTHLISKSDHVVFSGLNPSQMGRFAETEAPRSVFAVGGGLDFFFHSWVWGFRVAYDLTQSYVFDDENSLPYKNAVYQSTLSYQF
jgi:hypothetical protein